MKLNPENAYYFDLFYKISAYRGVGNGFGGIERIKPAEIESWCSYTGRQLNGFEKQLILELDQVFCKAHREESARVQEQEKNKGKPTKEYR